MTRKKKIFAASVLVLGLAGGGGYYYNYSLSSGILSVQGGKVVKQDLVQAVSANGEVKPKKYVNISSNTMGRIIRMPVKEGDRVREGDLLIQLESIQSEADVEAAQASLDAAETELDGMSAQIKSNDASIITAKAEIRRAEVDLERIKQNADRSKTLADEGLISREQFERAKADYDVAVAGLNSAHARLTQTEAQASGTLKQREGTTLRLAQQRSALIRARDQYSKTTISAPLAGIITYLPVNEGEIAIVGVQNSPGTVLMTIADLSIITAEVKVDETDIVNVKLGQEAEIRVDALGERVLKGIVSEVGNSALNRQGTSVTSSGGGGTQEARDFKVVITLQEPPAELRPGLSCTVKIITATSKSVLSIPIQALTIREFDNPDKTIKKKIEKEGVYIIKGGAVVFRPVKTGITGATDIEVLEGLKENEEIVTGPYQVLRTLQDNTKIKVEPVAK